MRELQAKFGKRRSLTTLFDLLPLAGAAFTAGEDIIVDGGHTAQ
jgi:hypothetical protein